MGRLIEEQAVIDCLTNTAKYYDMPQADEWTKGIHYGLLHGIDNILDNVKLVKAIPKADYEARLKADMIAMLKEIQDEIFKESWRLECICDDLDGSAVDLDDINNVIQQKINLLNGENK